MGQKMAEGWDGIRDRLWTIELWLITAEQEEYLMSQVEELVSELCDGMRVDWSISAGPMEEYDV